MKKKFSSIVEITFYNKPNLSEACSPNEATNFLFFLSEIHRGNSMRLPNEPSCESKSINNLIESFQLEFRGDEQKASKEIRRTSLQVSLPLIHLEFPYYNDREKITLPSSLSASHKATQ